MKSIQKLGLFWGLGLCIALFSWGVMTGFPGLVYGQASTPTPGSAPTSPIEQENLDEIQVTISLLGFDPIRGELDTRFSLDPQGKYLDPTTDFLTEDMQFIETFATTNQETDLNKERPIPSPLVKYVTYEGDANNYPFDRYATYMSFYLESREPETDGEYVPFSYQVEPNLPGFEIETVIDEEFTTDDYVAMYLYITRSRSVIFFAVMVMLIMWLLAIITALMAYRISQSKRLPEIGLLGFLGALLFAFPAIRNAQPNVPPVGTLGDFLSFFWAELIVVVSLIVVGVCWLKRYPMEPKP